MACVGYWEEQFSLVTKMFNPHAFLEGWETFRPKLPASLLGSVLSGEPGVKQPV